MLIYIIHDGYISTFRLPKEVSGNYMLSDVDVEDKNRSLINISSKDGKWYFNSNIDVGVYYNNSFVQEIEVSLYNFYTLNYCDKEFIVLYIFPGYESSYVLKRVVQESVITFGKNVACDISYEDNSIGEQQFELTFTNGIWKIKNLNPNVLYYINKIRQDNEYLSNFDTIFVAGIKMCFVGDCIIITYPPTKPIQFHSSQKFLDNFFLAKEESTSKEMVKEFYSSADYFYKSPIFNQKYDEYEISITPPDTEEEKNENSLISQIIPSAMMGVTSMVSLYFTVINNSTPTNGLTTDILNQRKETMITSIIMCVVMLFTGIVWPVIEHFAENIKLTIKNKKQRIDYNKYLIRKEEEMSQIVAKERDAIIFNCLSLLECQEAIKNKNSNLFSRSIESEAFLQIKCGIGRVKSSLKIDYSKPDMIVQKDDIYEDIDNLIKKYEYIENANFTMSIKNTSLAVIDITSNYINFMYAIILQLIGLHDYSNLKLVVLTKEGSPLNNIKNLNHCWNNEKTFRYFATNRHEGENISTELMKIANKLNEKENAEKRVETYYIIITDCIEKYKGIKIVDYIFNNSNNKTITKCMSLLVFTDKMTNVPTGCEHFINFDPNESFFFNSELNENNLIKFKPETVNEAIDFYGCVEKLSNIPIKVNISESTSNTSLPTKLGFLEMYGVGKIDQLHILERWKSAPITNTLAAPIGLDANGNLLYLDLHEKKHGPHGLVAGMTGSGKSEFIVTYILSLALNYSPDEVQFVLIDYKGGGLAGAFENRKTGIKLPHLVGTITNLDKSELNRTLVSIKSELQRRQRVFNEAKERLNTGSIDIYKYQMLVREGTIKEPLSHLFIFCDEFAELKAQQPDFMDELVSAARIGRSLGIHLILATQKPSGVVDEQIWSNAKFKVCCKVQTAEDSNEMLRNPDAAFIKESGRFYLQVGYDEYYVLGQSAYSGVQYVPSEMVATNIDNSLLFINNTGDSYRNASIKETKPDEEKTENLGEELTNILHYIVKIANENNYTYHQLWLDNVPTKLYYSNLQKKYPKEQSKIYDINPIVGEFDNPEKQCQGLVKLHVTGAGNTIVMGNSGSGKFTFLSTMIFSTIISHTSEEVNFYILDFGSEKFNLFKKAPHVGDVLTINDKNKIRYFFYMIETELNKRQKYYAENGGDFVLGVTNGKSQFPNIIIVIYGMEAFRENYDEIYDGLFSSIIRLSSKVGIEFVLSADSMSALGVSLENSVKQKVLLQLSDEADYSYFFKEARPPAKNPGRGVIMQDGIAVEFQTALIHDEMKQKEYLEEMFTKLRAVMNYQVKKVPDISKKLSLTEYLSYVTDLSDVPLGVNVMTAQQESYDFSQKTTLFSAEENKNVVKFFNKFSSIIACCENTNLIIINSIKELNLKVDEQAKYYTSDFSKIINLLYTNCEKLNNEKSNKNFVIMLLGYTSLNNQLMKLKAEDPDTRSLDELIRVSENENFKFFIYEESNKFDDLLNSEISDIIDNSNGIWVGLDYDGQSSFEMQEIRYGDNNINPSNELIVIIRESEPIITRYPTIE